MSYDNLSSEKQQNLSLKIILLGDPAVGKSNYLNRIVHKDFLLGTPSTIGIEFGYSVSTSKPHFTNFF